MPYNAQGGREQQTPLRPKGQHCSRGKPIAGKHGHDSEVRWVARAKVNLIRTNYTKEQSTGLELNRRLQALILEFTQ